ncbi:MAG TPA: peptidoglycan editing factor PgeF [Candidatus Limnocylindria bacterium]|nr:peptidoglycan editing factor PgeF [Candidatus Limnocylindria bacterium]
MPSRFVTCFSDRHGGVSRPPYASLNLGDHVSDDPECVATNRARLATEVGADQVRWMDQVHGDEVVVLDTPREPTDRPPRCDGLVTALPGLALGVLVADCVPVLMVDAHAGVAAAVHAGRRGVAHDIVARALEVMVGLGATEQRVEVLLGPSICGACYEVPHELQEELLSVVPAARATTRWGTPGLDLRVGLRDRLTGRVASVALVGPCTFESADHFSHRRDGVTGRTAGVVRFVV